MRRPYQAEGILLPLSARQGWGGGSARHPSETFTWARLDWQVIGCERAAGCGAEAEMVVNTRPVDELLTWTDASG